jgi:hypothetical protein
MYKKILIIITLILFVFIALIMRPVLAVSNLQVRSIDTVKYSRDLARQKLTDSSFDLEIDKQMMQIAQSGATHVAIGTPYDAEFLPILKRWVIKARKYGLKVWFRGNLSGWEGWFDYPKIDRATHINNIQNFILSNKDLFEDGDIFTSCPECENGGPGDPRIGDLKGFRTFLINEYSITKKAFLKINKKVTANYYSMNGDVAFLVMDKATTKALDGVVTVDHYVKIPLDLENDIKLLAENSSGKIVLGEMGVPIPDINGEMTDKAQAEWIAQAFARIKLMPQVIAVNYWTNKGSSTALFDDSGVPKTSALVLRKVYTGNNARGIVTDNNNLPVANATVSTLGLTYLTDSKGIFTIPYYLDGQLASVFAPGFKAKADLTLNNNPEGRVILTYINPPQSTKHNYLNKVITSINNLFIRFKNLLTRIKITISL